MMPDDTTSLGPCCICGHEGPTVRNILMLNARCPERGHGWGCFTCKLPSHGALAVLCDACTEQYQGKTEDHLQFVCRGYPGSDGRMPIHEVRGEHGHNWSKHPEATQVPPLTRGTTDTRFTTSLDEGQGCHCSRCGETIWAGTGAIRAWPDSGEYEYRYHPTCLGFDPQHDDPYAEDAYWYDYDPEEHVP